MTCVRVITISLKSLESFEGMFKDFFNTSDLWLSNVENIDHCKIHIGLLICCVDEKRYYVKCLVVELV